MYPIENYKVNDPDKIEAIRYYLELNKTYLKEVSREEYELFAEYLKGEGKEIMFKIEKCETPKELDFLLKRIEKMLPYASKLSKFKTFEEKVNLIHNLLAKQFVKHDEIQTSNQILNKQRKMAKEYDQLLEQVKEYQEVVLAYRELKEKLADTTMVRVIFKSKMASEGVNEIGNAIKNALEQKYAAVKEKRALVFNEIKNYYVKEQAYVMEQEMVAVQK